MTFIITPWAIKTCHFVFDWNSGVSCSIFILFLPLETGRNTVQYILIHWLDDVINVSNWTSQKFTSYSYFSKLNMFSLKIGVNFLSNGNAKVFLQKTDKRIFYQELEKTNIGRLSAKVTNNRFNRTHCDDWLQNLMFICRFSFTR